MIFLNKKGIFVISVLLLSVFTFIFCFSSLNRNNIGETNASKLKIVLDAGHGGIDGGVSGVTSGIKESELNLKVVKKLEKYFSDVGISVVLTRNSDAGLYGVATKNLKKKDMEKRREIIRKAKPNLVISIHMNKYSVSTRRGAQVFYKSGDDKGKLLASSIQNSFNQMPEATRECSILTGDYFILNCTDYPSIIAECGFLSNPEEESLLITDEYQDSISYAIFKGTIGYLSQLSYKI